MQKLFYPENTRWRREPGSMGFYAPQDNNDDMPIPEPGPPNQVPVIYTRQFLNGMNIIWVHEENVWEQCLDFSEWLDLTEVRWWRLNT